MQRLPGLMRHFKRYLLLYPLVFERLDLSGFDLVLSSSSAFAKAVRAPRGGLHVCYCYTPARFLWSYDQYVEREELGLASRGRRCPLGHPRPAALGSGRPPAGRIEYVAISTAVAERIRRIYGRDAAVVRPGRRRALPWAGGPAGDYYLIVSRLNAYKRIHLAVEAFNRLRLPLVIAGEGPHRPALERMAGPTIRFLGTSDDGEVGEAVTRAARP